MYYSNLGAKVLFLFEIWDLRFRFSCRKMLNKFKVVDNSYNLKHKILNFYYLCNVKRTSNMIGHYSY